MRVAGAEVQEAIARLFPREPFEPAKFVRHYEDAARILRRKHLVSRAALSRLLDAMRTDADIRRWPAPDDPAFDPEADPERWRELQEAWTAIGPMFWGGRIPLADCAGAIREVVRSLR